MSLINQVLRDLDSREPLQDRPANVRPAASAANATSTDWVRLLVWGLTGLLVIAFVGYIYLVEKKQPGPVVIEPAATRLVPKQIKPLENIPPGPVEVTEVPATSVAIAKEDAGVLVDDKAVNEPTLAVAETPQKLAEAASDTPSTPDEVAYLPLHDDGKKIEMAEPASSEQPKARAEISVTKAVQAPIAIARDLVANGRLTEAEAKLQQILKDKPSDVNARELLIGLQLRADRSAEAAEQIQQGLKFYPHRENLVLLHARMLLDKQDVDAAIRVLEDQVRKKKAGSKTLAMLAPLYQKKSRFASSEQLYRKLLEYDPAEAPYWVGLAVSLEALAKSDEAASAYQRALNSGGLSESLQRYAMQRINTIRQQDMTNE